VYFTPRGESPTGCSFIRLNKVDLGVDLFTGVEEKYGRVEGNTAGVDHEEIRDLRKEIGARFVEVGWHFFCFLQAVPVPDISNFLTLSNKRFKINI